MLTNALNRILIANKMQQDANNNLKTQCVTNEELPKTIELLRADIMDLRNNHQLQGGWAGYAYAHRSMDKNNEVQGQNLVHPVKQTPSSKDSCALYCHILGTG